MMMLLGVNCQQIFASEQNKAEVGRKSMHRRTAAIEDASRLNLLNSSDLSPAEKGLLKKMQERRNAESKQDFVIDCSDDEGSEKVQKYKELVAAAKDSYELTNPFASTEHSSSVESNRAMSKIFLPENKRQNEHLQIEPAPYESPNSQSSSCQNSSKHYKLGRKSNFAWTAEGSSKKHDGLHRSTSSGYISSSSDEDSESGCHYSAKIQDSHGFDDMKIEDAEDNGK